MHFKKILGAAFAVALSAGAAPAAVLDFYASAFGNERGVDNFVDVDVTGTTVQFDAGDHYAYFDHDAGLGVCKVVDNPGVSGGTGNMCNTPISNPASDDNITLSESVSVLLGGLSNLSNLVFRAEGHAIRTDDKTLLFSINDEALQRYTFAQLSTLTFQNVMKLNFSYDDAGTNADQYYVSAATVVPVPLPAAGLMLLAGLGALGAARRRRT